MKDNTFTIEPVTSGSEELTDSLNSLMKQLNPAIKSLTPDEIQAIIQANDTWLFVAKNDTQSIVGTLTLISYRTPSGVRGYVEDVVVDENYRGNGIGEMLMSEAIAKAKELRLEYIGLTSRPEREAANRLYQRLGFQKRETNVYRLNF